MHGGVGECESFSSHGWSVSDKNSKPVAAMLDRLADRWAAVGDAIDVRVH
ncbi:MAG: hypothetical protein AB7K09_25115 [Planctomycetota bacterium]